MRLHAQLDASCSSTISLVLGWDINVGLPVIALSQTCHTIFDTSSQQHSGKVPQYGRKIVRHVCPLPGELMVVAARWHQQVVVSKRTTRVPVHAP